jgi:hypothetical protein
VPVDGRTARRAGVLASALLAAACLMAAPAGAAFPGANGNIAFQGGDFDIHSMEPGGSVPVNLTHTAAGDFQPAWSPDGNRIAFGTLGAGNRAEIHVMDADGSHRSSLTSAETIEASAPAWSPDGQRIAFQGRLVIPPPNLAELDIFVMDADGGDVTRITTDPAFDAFPAWSPDGQKIAFTSTRDDGSANIFVMGPGGENPTRLTDSNGEYGDQRPSWSPDGQQIAFESNRDTLSASDLEIYVMNADGTEPSRRTTNPATDFMAAWSPDGEKIAFSSNRDDASESEVYVMDADGSDQTKLTTRPGFNGKPDWQTLPAVPIVFIHGFLGSEISCGARELWPHIGILDRPSLPEMRLAADGSSNLGDSPCSQLARPNGDLVLEVASSDIYQSTVDFLQSVAPGNHSLYAWDWRRSPADAIAGLDLEIERARCGGTLPENATTCAAPVHEQVVLMAHSMGGLVTRAYIDSPARAAKVARALTIGTPYWGSPKAVFPLAAGIEAPGFSGLDAFLDNDDLHEFAQNLTGAYSLWPSAPYGPWLTVGGAAQPPLDEAGVLDYVASGLGGNADLLDRMLDLHASTLDGFETNGVDYRVLAGSGFNTIRTVRFKTGAFTDFALVGYGNGDGTVPIESAVQGAGGTSDPLGENIPIHYACGVRHVPLPGDPAVTARIRGFLLRGTEILGTAGPCPAGGFELQYHEIEIAGPASIRTPSALAATPVEQAGADDLVDVLEFAAGTLIVTSARQPADFTLDGAHYRLVVTPIGPDGAKGAEVVYGSLSGEVTIASGTELHVLAAGREVAPDGTGGPPAAGGPIRGRGDETVAAPRISGLRLAPVRFRALRSGGSITKRPRAGTRLAYRLSRAARVKFAIERRATGHRSGGRCRRGAKAPGGRSCVLFLSVRGGFGHGGRAGANGLRFSGRAGGRTLPPGAYRLLARVTGGNTVRAPFAIAR